MPELPDVEYFRRYANATVLHHSIDRVAIFAGALLQRITSVALRDSLVGRSFSVTRRYGKYLIIRVADHGYSALHFSMTGQLKFCKHERELPRYARLLVDFDNGYHFVYMAARKPGRSAHYWPTAVNESRTLCRGSRGQAVPQSAVAGVNDRL